MLLSHNAEWDSVGVQLLCCHSLLAYSTSENAGGGGGGGGKRGRGEGEFVFGLSLSTIHSFFCSVTIFIINVICCNFFLPPFFM